MIAVLCAWAPRARNLAETVIGTSLQRRGNVWWATFGSEQTKNKRPIEVPLPDTYSAWIERYLDHYRPLLLARSSALVAGDAFWLSGRGKPLTTKGVGRCVSAVTKRELGRAINPHLFRKVITTELAIHDPGHVGIAQPLLGHADYRTTQQAYNLGRAIDAARQYQSFVRSVRSGSSTIAAGPPSATPAAGTVARSPYPRRSAR
jgi:integrase